MRIMFSIRIFGLRGVSGVRAFPNNPARSFLPDETDSINSKDTPSPEKNKIKATRVMVSPTAKVAVWQGMQMTLFAGSTEAEAPTELPLV